MVSPKRNGTSSSEQDEGDTMVEKIIHDKKGGEGTKRTLICRSVALVNESITRGMTLDNGRCFGYSAPEAGVWFLKCIYDQE